MVAKIRTDEVAEPAQAKKFEDLLLMKVFEGGLCVCEAARNIGPDTPEKNSVIEEVKREGGIGETDIRRCSVCKVDGQGILGIFWEEVKFYV